MLVALVYTLPWLLWLRWVPERWRSRMWHRVLFHAALALFWAWQVFQHALEFYFFEEFRSRFNTVSVDYLLYPHEVFVNIWESYPIVHHRRVPARGPGVGVDKPGAGGDRAAARSRRAPGGVRSRWSRCSPRCWSRRCRCG